MCHVLICGIILYILETGHHFIPLTSNVKMSPGTLSPTSKIEEQVFLHIFWKEPKAVSPLIKLPPKYHWGLS